VIFHRGGPGKPHCLDCSGPLGIRAARTRHCPLRTLSRSPMMAEVALGVIDAFQARGLGCTLLATLYLVA
jgi:hypothetical protein